MDFSEWLGFKKGKWSKEINVRDFIQKNYIPYEGDESFLVGPTERTQKLWQKVLDLFAQERAAGGVLDCDTAIISQINSHEAGYIDKKNEVIVGLQTDAPLKRIVNPYGGIRMVYQELESYGYKLNEDVDKYFNL